MFFNYEMECNRRKDEIIKSCCAEIDYLKNLLNCIYGAKSHLLATKLNINKVIFNDPATIVFWEDGTKTVVKAHDEPFDKEKGLAMAIVKKMYGNKGSYFNEIKKWTKDEEADQSSPKNVRIFDEINVFSDKFNVLSDAIRASLRRMGVTNDKTEEPSDRNNDKTDKSDINRKKEQTKTPYVTIDGSNLYSD